MHVFQKWLTQQRIEQANIKKIVKKLLEKGDERDG